MTAPGPFEPSEALWAELSVGADRCAGRRCPLLGACFAEAARARAPEADLVIANHALYFADVAAGGGVLPEHDAVIFDEAHRLEETAATWLGGRVSRAGLRRLAADTERACREADETVPARALDRVEQAGERLLRAVSPPAGRRRLREIPVESAPSWSTRSPHSQASSTVAQGSTSSPAGAPRRPRRSGVPRARRPRASGLGRARGDRMGPSRRVGRASRPPLGRRAHRRSRLGDSDDRRGRDVRPPPPRPRRGARAGRRLAL